MNIGIPCRPTLYLFTWYEGTVIKKVMTPSIKVRVRFGSVHSSSSDEINPTNMC